MVDFDELWDYGRPAETEAKFRALLPEAEAAGDADYLAQLLTQLARTLGLQRQFAAAHELLDRVEGVAQAGTIAQVRCLLERGRCFNSAGDKGAARPLFMAAYEQAAVLGADFYTVDALHMLAIVDPSAAQIEWNEQALAVAAQSDDPRARGWVGSLTNNLAWTYHDLGNYDRALVLFEQALAFRQAQGNAENIRVAKWCIARTLRSLGRVEEALARQQELAAGEQDGYVFEELGECLLLLGRAEEARPYFGQAYGLLSQDGWLVANEGARLERLKRLGEGEIGD
ncbi:MAG: tetratricopeptide repeat protein [Chloroflexota bacterium]